MSFLKGFPRKYPSFLDTSFVLAGLVTTQILEIEPTLGVLAYTLLIVAIVIVGRILEHLFSKSGRKGLAERVEPLIGKAVAQVLTWAADFSVGVGFGIVLGLRTWWSVGFLAIYFASAMAMRSLRSAFHSDKTQKGSVLSPDVSEQNFALQDELSASEGWFRREDLHEFSKRHLALMAVYGGIVGFAASALLLLYAILINAGIIPLFFLGVVAATVLLAGVGLLRSRILRHVAAKGFPAVFRFRRIAFTFYIYSVLTGALGLGYGYGYFSAQSTTLVLPLAGLFILFLYLNLLWRDVLVGSEEGRLCIFQFIAEHGEDGSGFAWLKRGLSKTRSLLESFGVSAKRNSLYFGSSYSLLEGSYLEWDLDSIYFLGDWTSEPNEMRPVHEIASWFLHRSKKAEKRGFSRVFLFIDHLYEISPQSAYYIIAAVGVIVGIVTALLRR